MDPLSGASLMADVETYVGFGIHHTGLAGDLATSAWQKAWLEGLGYDVSLSDVPVRQYVSTRSDAVLDQGGVVDLWYQWPQPIANAVLDGKIVDRTEDTTTPIRPGDIVLVREVGNSIDLPENLALIRPALDAGAGAVIAVCSHESGKYQIGNVLETIKPFPAPVLLAGSNDLARLRASQSAQITLAGQYQQAIGQSVTGRIDRGKKWLIVSTPQSGWTTCGGERGPGIAVFRALAAELAAEMASDRIGPSLCFTSNSGHEFHNLGARILHDQHGLPDPEDTALWLHLGAGIASRDWTVDESGTITHQDQHKGTILMVTPGIGAITDEITPADNIKIQSYTTDQFNVGEMLDVTANGYDPAIGAVGHQSHHHVFGDLPLTTSAPILEGVARYMLAITRQVLG